MKRNTIWHTAYIGGSVSVHMYTVGMYRIQDTIHSYVRRNSDKTVQSTSVALYCSTILQHYTAALYCSTLLQHSTAALQHYSLALHCALYCSTILQHYTAALHYSTTLQHCIAALYCSVDYIRRKCMASIGKRRQKSILHFAGEGGRVRVSEGQWETLRTLKESKICSRVAIRCRSNN